MFDLIGLALSLLLARPDAVPLGPDLAFHPRERSVGNWRWQAAENLDASPGRRANILLGRDPAAVTRCVRLNNYWCIKRGGWSGEIAADAEGHVAFVSAAEGAAVAALLLRRYYVDYGRHSATAIVSRWAPASCGAPSPRRRAPGAIARGGFGGTLRARWLAAHRGRVAGVARMRGRVSAIPDRLIGASGPSPTIALGLGPAPASLSASLPEALAARPGPLPAPAPACAGDAARIAAYASKAAAGITASPDGDLALFDAEGRPTPNLARLMRNMAAVEIGPLGVREELVAAAVAHAAEIVAARRPAPSAAASLPPDEARRPKPDPNGTPVRPGEADRSPTR